MDDGFNDGNIRSSLADQKRDRSSSLNESPSAKRRNSVEDDDLLEGHEESGSFRTHGSRDASISGSPFIRVPTSQSHSPLGRSIESVPSKDVPPEGQADPRSRPPSRIAPKPSNLRATVSFDELTQDSTRDETNPEYSQVKIPVGASRLHLVELPNLKMKPIYWNPLHDISAVVRATWFYKNSMLPVEMELANKLEEGYAYLKPWTDTWQDELNSCVENGADAEAKVAHQL
jgi:hypothetical protein